jgi:hypothetical protein
VRELCTEWWDLFAGAVLYLDARGRTPQEIAQHLGMPEDQVKCILTPMIPAHNGMLWHYSDQARTCLRDYTEELVASILARRWRWSVMVWAEDAGEQKVMQIAENNAQRWERQAAACREHMTEFKSVVFSNPDDWGKKRTPKQRKIDVTLHRTLQKLFQNIIVASITPHSSGDRAT